MAELSKQIENINGQAINSADKQMNAVYNKQKQAQEEIMAFIALLYFNYEINGSIKLNGEQKREIFRQLNAKLIRIYNSLGNTEKEVLTNILINNYKFLYDETFNIVNIYGSNKPAVTEQEVLMAVYMPIANILYTDRIWANKDKTINLLRKSVTNILNGKTSSDMSKKQIENIFNLTAYDSNRLMISEDTRVRAQASNDVCEALGIKKHIWMATFENTCKECKELHGHEFDINDKTAPTQPLHSNCKCYWLIKP